MRVLFAIVLLSAMVGPASHAAPGPTGAPPPAPAGARRYAVELTLVDVAGAPLVLKRFEATIGQTQPVLYSHEGRTVSADATFSAGDRAGCVATKLVVVDRRIDAAGHFTRTDWSSTVQSCDASPLTVGHPDQVRVVITIRPAASSGHR